jgi:hypothetical protein
MLPILFLISLSHYQHIFFLLFFFFPFSSLISHLSHTMMSLFHEHEGFFIPDINFVVFSFIFSFLNVVEKQMKTSENF